MIGAAVGQAIRFSLFIFGANNQKAAIMKRQFQFRLLLMALERKSLQQVELGISNFLELVGRCSEILSGDTHNVINIFFFDWLNGDDKITHVIQWVQKDAIDCSFIMYSDAIYRSFPTEILLGKCCNDFIVEFTDFTRDRGFNK